MLLRLCVMAIATLAAAGCVSSGYYGGYDTYPGEATYDYPPYGYGSDYPPYGYGSYGYGSYGYGYGSPYGYGYPYSYHRHDHDDHDRHDDNDNNDRDHKHKHGDARYFIPSPGVTCDREGGVCRDKSGVNDRWTNRMHNDQPSRPGKVERPPRVAGNVDRDVRRPSAQRDNNGNGNGQNFLQRHVQRLNNQKPGNACPPRGCTD